jgi:hypothetical protein
MKKIIIFILFNLFCGVIASQDKLIYDSGYYYGSVENSTVFKYLFMYFSSEDDMVYITPYIVDGEINELELHNDFMKMTNKMSFYNINGNFFSRT